MNQTLKVQEPTFFSNEKFPAFALTAAPLLIWYLAGLLTDPAHPKILDYAAFASFFCIGPILIWLAAHRIESVSNSITDRMTWAIAIQSLLTLTILGLVWAPSAIIKATWYIPCAIHLATLLTLFSRSCLLDRNLERNYQIAEKIVQNLTPLLPGLLLVNVLAFSPDIRDGLLRLSNSRTFLVGFAGGTTIAFAALLALQFERTFPLAERLKSIGQVVALLSYVVAVIMLFDTTLWFDWIHYGTYIGPANAVLHGRFPTVDAFSQYGILNYLLYTIGFILTPVPTLTSAAAVSSVVNLATSACMLLLLRRLCGFTWFALLFGILAIYIASHLAPFPMNPYPNFRGMRFLPAALIVVALAYIPTGRRYTLFSVISFAFGLLWSFEGAICALGSYIAFLAVVETTYVRRARALIELALLSIATYVFISLLTYAFIGSWPRFDVYLNLVFGYVSVGTYAAANWLKAIDPHELLWVPLTIVYFGVLTVAWRALIDCQHMAGTLENRAYVARIAAVAACGTILLSLFVFRSLTVYLLVAAPLGLILLFALTAAAWRNPSVSRTARKALAAPFVLTVALSSAILANVFMEKDPLKVITHDVSAAHNWVRTKTNVFSTALHRLKNPDSDYDIGMSFPWKPDRLREASKLVDRWFPNEKNLIAFIPESAALLLRQGKADRFPISYSLSELMTPSVADSVATASSKVILVEGEKLLVANKISELNSLETRILMLILNDWDAVPVETGDYSTVYRLQRKSAIEPLDRLKLPVHSTVATASSTLSPLYSAAAASDWWEVTNWSSTPKSNPSTEWLQIDLGNIKSLKRIEIIPFWPILDAFPSRFTVLVSIDGSSWEKIASEERFHPNWGDYQTRPARGYEIQKSFIKARWIRLAMDAPYANSHGAYIAQIAEILAFER